MGSLTSPYGSASGLRHTADGFACQPPYALTPGRPPPGTATLLRLSIGLPTARSVPPLPSSRRTQFGELASLVSAWTIPHGYGNINPLSIDYACRPRLRSRLTLGGLACPRNPWSIGGGASHSSFATHACILTHAASTAGSPRCFTRCMTLSYPATPVRDCRGFGGVLEPRYIVGAESLDQ
jgi:hypothetical protein